MNIFKITLAADAAADAATRAFSGVAYSGGLIHDYNAVIDLSSVALPASMPLLLQHNHAKVIGKIDGADVVDGALLITGELFTSDEDAADVIAKADAGAEYQMSVGIWYSAAAQVAEGAAVSVNGQAFAGPLEVLTGGTIREVSVVALGADPETSMVLLTADPAAVITTGAIEPTDPVTAPAVDPVELSAVMRLAVADAKVAELSAQIEDLTTRATSAAIQVVELTAARDTATARVAALEAAAEAAAAADKAAAVEAAVSAAVAAGKVPPASAASARALATADLAAFEGLMAGATVIAPQRADGDYTKQQPTVSLSAEHAAMADAAGIPHAIFAASLKRAATLTN